VVERADLDARGDVACFTTHPLLAPLRLLGEPRLRIVVAADQPGFDLCAALSVVDVDGRAVRQLCVGVARFRGGGCLRAQERGLSLQPLCATLRPGERLRLSVAAAAWPQIAVNPGDGTVPSGAVGPAHRVIRLTMDLAAGRLWLEPWTGAN
jgi:predicted acyl esterase